MQNIIPNLWFEGQAEEAVAFYLSIFKHAKVLQTARYDEQGAKVSGRPKGSVMNILFNLDGQEFMALNGGPGVQFSPAISFMVNCDTQAEVDRLWEKLSAGGAKERCGWLKDKYGVSWQIVPKVLGELMQDQDPVRSGRVMAALQGMTKIDIEGLKRAYRGK